MKSSFLVADVFNIEGRGVVATGIVKSGSLMVGMEVVINDIKMKIKQIELFNKEILEAEQGSKVGIILENGDRDLIYSARNREIVFTDKNEEASPIKVEVKKDPLGNRSLWKILKSMLNKAE
jgi:translation elongation factor EF-Tu-like GTPase